jgi:REP element-mobilizing transposase RayT
MQPDEDITKLFLVTWVTHSSRISERMKKYSKNKGLQPLVLSDEEEIEVTEYINEIVKKDMLKILSYNICKDHIHLILFCNEANRDNIVRKLKGKSAQSFKEKRNINAEFHLWAQKYNWTYVLDEKALQNAYIYVKYNRQKHNLTENKKLENIIANMITPYEQIFN